MVKFKMPFSPGSKLLVPFNRFMEVCPLYPALAERLADILLINVLFIGA